MSAGVRIDRNALGLLVALVVGLSGTVEAATSESSDGPPAASPSGPCRTLMAGPQLLAIPVAGVEREVLVFVPTRADRPGPMPLVLAFHAHGAHAGQFAATSGLSNAALEDGFVVAYPQGEGDPPDWHILGAPWDPIGSPDDMLLVESLLDRLGLEGCIDEGRLVLVGHSKGGGMAQAVACRFADRVRGVVLTAATQFGLRCQPARPVPVVAFHALNDPILPYAGGRFRNAPPDYPGLLPVEEALATWATLDGCAGGPTTTDLPRGDAVLTWKGCLAPVVLHRLARGGHRYPAAATAAVRDMVRDTAPAASSAPAPAAS